MKRCGFAGQLLNESLEVRASVTGMIV